ncbi:hypothetical protein B0A48_03989 [Cryoendolithus antarcticus]|uniref:C2H2-type domain-containing protein n=1 Tax=Cryoendolithus antarcticus TaxID=1507870 RepID=A0A1V8TH24_9PEZI|nr:hypothetical protein B0A48_03989 [Cryoendolithus antarcticus]
MAPHGSSLPKAATESAKAARRAFFCELCQKGYARMNEYEAHEGSYDHQHRKRLKEMKSLTRDPSLNQPSASTSRSTKGGDGELRSLALPPTTPATGAKKKPVFRTVGAAPSAPTSSTPSAAPVSSLMGGGDESGAIRNGWASEAYDPGVVNGCSDDCGVCDPRTRGRGIVLPI